MRHMSCVTPLWRLVTCTGHPGALVPGRRNGLLPCDGSMVHIPQVLAAISPCKLNFRLVLDEISALAFCHSAYLPPDSSTTPPAGLDPRSDSIQALSVPRSSTTLLLPTTQPFPITNSPTLSSSYLSSQHLFPPNTLLLLLPLPASGTTFSLSAFERPKPASSPRPYLVPAFSSLSLNIFRTR